ncbi:MAG: hypothetical protein RLY75_630 [Pseudomonadota bacterium]
MLSTLAELKIGFDKGILWITLCKTFQGMCCKSLIDGEVALISRLQSKIELNN